MTDVGTLLLSYDGQGAPPARIEAMRDALRTQRYDGQTGLGLMLADLVARAHGGRLDLPPTARGFAAELVLAVPPLRTAD
jgi:signal transduction histidine kinase